MKCVTDVFGVLRPKNREEIDSSALHKNLFFVMCSDEW